ncbi:MAG: YajD family HNH nuclease [Pseudomonadota bacterium]|nr:YajD family HNH nuclease [Pseudomonadota bacterium]
MKAAERKPPGEDYRERSLAIHGLVCAHCGREFSGVNRRLLTVHHKDGNHHNNPPDGSNWENLCVYCHENAHSREVLGDYLDGAAAAREAELVYQDRTEGKGSPVAGSLGEKLRAALARKHR